MQLEVQLQKYKKLCEKKAKEVKHLQDQVSRLKRKEFKRSGVELEPDDSSMAADVTKVKKKILC